MRTERAIWATLAAAPLLALGVCAVLALTLRPQPPRSGDALLDTFLEAVLRDNPLLRPEERTSYADLYTAPDLTLPEAAIEALEQDFGPDPRFWMLRYRFARLSEMDSAAWEGMGYSRKQLSILEEARTRGSIDAAGLFQLLSRKRSIWLTQAGDECVAEGLSPKADPQSFRKARRGKMDTRHGAEERALFAELQAASPGSAMPHYWLAQDWTDRGDYGAAIAELQRGNAAPVLSLHIGFPFELAQELAGQPQSRLDDTLSGALLMNISEFGYPNHTNLKRMCKLLTVDATSRRDARALTAVHSFICRYAGLSNSGMLASLVSLTMWKEMEKDIYALWPGGLTADQQKALSSLQAPRGRILSEAQRLNRLHPGFGPSQAGPKLPWQQTVEAGLGGAASTTVRACREWAVIHAQERQALTGPVAQAVEELSRFEFDPKLWR